MNKNTSIIQNLSQLYELSLAIGTSLHLVENCTNFLKALLAGKNLTFAAIWLNKNELYTDNGNNRILIAGLPASKIDQTICTEDIFLYDQIDENAPYSVLETDDKFSVLIQEKDIEGGAYAIFKLREIGYLKLYAKDRKKPFSLEDMDQLKNVLDKLYHSLIACLAHRELEKETKHRIAAQKAQKASEDLYKTVVQSLSEGIMITDLEGKVTYVNDQMVELAGYDKSELIGQIAFDLLSVKDEKQYFSKVLTDRKKGVSSQYEKQHVRKNGEIWWGNINASPYRNDKGEIIGTIGAVSDITRQKYLEEQKNIAQEKAKLFIKNNEFKLRQIIDTSLDAIINIDEDGIVTEWNKQAEIIFGYSRFEAIDKNMGDLIIPLKYREAHRKGMEHFLKTGEGPVLNSRIEITAINREEEEFPIELSISPIKFKDRYIFSGFIRDISERKKAENDLIQAKKEADQSRMAEQQFLANMSHEIRTPMNAVIGMTYLLYEANPSPAQIEYLDTLKFSADSLMGIINNILDLSKIEAGEFEFEPRTFNLRELILALQQTFQFKVKDKPVSVVADIDPKLTTHIIGDDNRLNQILTNLLGNASKFTHRGTIGISVKLIKKQADTYHIEFKIHDTGIGMAADKIPQIFENFKQLEENRKFGGTGLGLSIVKQLVSLQGGTLHVESAPNKGSQFSIILPFKDSGIPVTEVIRPVIVGGDYVELFSRTQILVVEDNIMNQRLIKKILELWKCNFDLAENGLIALENTKQKKYDIILMDIHMPEMDGIESAKQIRSDGSNLNQNTPIVALTAAALLDERNRVFEVGMNDFLTKPFSPKILESTLIKWLDYTPKAAPEEKEKRRTIAVSLDYLQEFSNGDEEFIKEMINMFLDNTPVDIEALQKHLMAQNWEQVYKTAHKLKPNFMMVGMKAQEKVSENIEVLTNEDNIDKEQITSLIKNLVIDAEAAYPILKGILGKF